MTYRNAEVRRQVIERAGNCCEYCRLHQHDKPFSFHIEHVISVKHRGTSDLSNLCLSCPDCNAFKGSDIGSIDDETGILTTLFNPREQDWPEHFYLRNSLIEPLTAHGRVTVFLLRLNTESRLMEREILIRLGRYPCQTD